jgi:hypothetical protein
MHIHDQETQSADSSPHPVRGEASPVLALQRSAGNQAVAGVLDVVGSGGGTALDTDTRSFMEASLGHDFSAVRVHTDGPATESARSIGAEAFTVGTDVVVQADRWAPETDAGQELLAHELTHVVQQAAGPVDGTPVDGGIQLSDPGDRFEIEASRTAAAVVAQRLTESEMEDDAGP